jgi:hypothetical protein
MLLGIGLPAWCSPQEQNCHPRRCPSDGESLANRTTGIAQGRFSGKGGKQRRQASRSNGRFLDTTAKEETTLLEEFLDDQTRRSYKKSASEFGDLVFAILSALGEDNAFFRLLVV